MTTVSVDLEPRAFSPSDRWLSSLLHMPTTHRAASAMMGIAGVTIALVLTGCSSVGSGEAQARSAALRFHQALEGGDASSACGLLAPRTRAELESSAKTPCAKALPGEGLPKAVGVGVGVGTTDVYGTNARVVLDGDTLFLARFGAQWKVTAAGCEPRPDLPYDCHVKGG